MDFENFFKERLAHLHAEGRYCVFANLERAMVFCRVRMITEYKAK
jgi:hypothetical protein